MVVAGLLNDWESCLLNATMRWGKVFRIVCWIYLLEFFLFFSLFFFGGGWGIVVCAAIFFLFLEFLFFTPLCFHNWEHLFFASVRYFFFFFLINRIFFFNSFIGRLSSCIFFFKCSLDVCFPLVYTRQSICFRTALTSYEASFHVATKFHYCNLYNY